jgi:hypothetical protein
MNWFTKLLHGPAPRVAQSAANRVRPECELLEARTLLDVGFSLTGTVLTLTGDGSAETVLINDSGLANGVRVTTLDWSRNFTVPLTEIVVNTNGGNDNVVYFLNGNLQAGVQRKVKANLGGGSDVFFARLSSSDTAPGSDLLAGARLAFHVQGDKGRDSTVLNADRGTDIGARAALTVDFAGGSDNDLVTAAYRGRMDGELYLLLDGQEHDDTVSATLTFDAGSSGLLGGVSQGFGNARVSAQVRGGAAADTLWFLVRNNGRVRGNPRMEGGTGWDRGTRTANVTPVSIDSDTVV